MPVSSHSTETRQARQKGTIKLCGKSEAPRPSYLMYVSRVTPSSSAISSTGYRADGRMQRDTALALRGVSWALLLLRRFGL